MKILALLIIAATTSAQAADYWIPPTATPIQILQPRLIDLDHRIPTGEVGSYRPVYPIYSQPVWGYPPQYQYPGYTLTPIYYGHQQVWPMPANAQYIRWSNCPIVYPVGQWVPLYR